MKILPVHGLLSLLLIHLLSSQELVMSSLLLHGLFFGLQNFNQKWLSVPLKLNTLLYLNLLEIFFLCLNFFLNSPRLLCWLSVLLLLILPFLKITKAVLNFLYHHFWSHIENGNLSISWIDTKYQLADIFTKRQASSSFVSLRQALLGWQLCNQRKCWYVYVITTAFFVRYLPFGSARKPRHKIYCAQQTLVWSSRAI